jgi:hypothetical protein
MFKALRKPVDQKVAYMQLTDVKQAAPADLSGATVEATATLSPSFKGPVI